jgi:hypothetical protein
MEIIDFNPYTIRRRLSAEVGAEKGVESASALVLGHGETVAKDQDDGGGPMVAAHIDGGMVVSGENADPKHDEQENRSRIVIDGPFQLPGWIPTEAAVNCSLPYTSYEIPIPLDLNMDFCIDVMMGQDTIVFMFVRGTYPLACRLMLILGGVTGQRSWG